MEIKLDRTDLGFLIHLLKQHREGLAQWKNKDGTFPDECFEEEYVSTGELATWLTRQRDEWDAR